MKKSILFTLLAIPMIALMFGFSNGKGGNDTEDKKLPIPYNAVGVIYNGTAHVLTNHCVWTFRNGGTISDIHFEAAEGSLWMVRTGTNSSGAGRSEKFKVSISNGFIVYIPTLWFVCIGNCNCEYHQDINDCWWNPLCEDPTCGPGPQSGTFAGPVEDVCASTQNP